MTTARQVTGPVSPDTILAHIARYGDARAASQVVESDGMRRQLRVEAAELFAVLTAMVRTGIDLDPALDARLDEAFGRMPTAGQPAVPERVSDDRLAEIVALVNKHRYGSPHRNVISLLPEYRGWSWTGHRGAVVAFELVDGTVIARADGYSEWAVRVR